MDRLSQYHQILSEIVIAKLSDQIQQAERGHCLRLEGLPFNVLRYICAELQNKVSKSRVALLSNQPREVFEVSATKLIELRNLAENAYVLLVLIPSNLRTAAEDSFDRSTFKQIDINVVPSQIIRRIEEEIPGEYMGYYQRINSFFSNIGQVLPPQDHAEYLLYSKQDGWSKEAWGNNLFLLGFIPDAKLLESPEHLEQRLRQNYSSVERLRDENQALINRVNSLEIEPNSIQKSLFDFLIKEGHPEDVKTWGEKISNEEKYSCLNFGFWPLIGIRGIEELQLFVHPLRGQNILNQEGEKRIVTKENREVNVTISFDTKPAPMDINALSHFRVDLMQTGDGGVIERTETLIKFKKTPGRTARRSKQISLNPVQISEGVYFFRVLALDEAGTILNRNDSYLDPYLQKEWENRKQQSEDNASRDGLNGKLTCDTEDFYFRIEESDEDNEDGGIITGRRKKASSLFQTIVQTRLDYIDSGYDLDSLKINEKYWTDQGSGSKQECNLEVHFNDLRQHYFIPIATVLRSISYQILKSEKKLGTYRIDLSGESDTGQRLLHLQDNQLGEIAPQAFLDARQKAFEKILHQIEDESGNALGVVEVCDLIPIAEDIETYIAEYSQWLSEILTSAESSVNEDHLSAMRKLQLMDHVELVFPSSGGHRERVYILTPLHPLRLAWLLQLQRLYYHWESNSLEDSSPKRLWTQEIREIFLGGLHPTNHPRVIQGRNFKNFYYIGEISPGWGIYSPLTYADEPSEMGASRILLNHAQSILGIPTQLRQEADFSLARLYRQIRRYLIQHPYVDTFHINFFNPGDGRKLVECLEELQREKLFENLRYEIRLIAPSSRIGEIGSAFDEFLRPSGLISDEAEAFVIPTSNSLFPKIRFSKNTLEDYLEQPQAYEAHLSIQLDLFPVEVKLIKPDISEKQSVFCHGLMLQPVDELDSANEVDVAWVHYLALNESNPISEDDTLTQLHIESLRKLQQMISITLAGAWTSALPALSLFLNNTGRALLHQIHEYSDWVITIDQNLGIDLFDTPVSSDYIPYLLDYSPGNAVGDPPFFLTSRPTSEIHGLLMPHLTKYQLIEANDSQKLYAFLEALRSVSSSIIMQLASSPTKAFEAIGIGLSRLLLNHLGLLENQFMIPLDMHRELFAGIEEYSTENSSQQRGDFLLVNFGNDLDNIHIQVVEVKCRTQIGSGKALEDLRAKMTEQLENTVFSLRYNFDQSLHIPDRLDRAMKDRQFFELLEFYLYRSRRYRLISDSGFDAWRRLLSRLHHGYSLTLDQVGLIFEFEGEHDKIITIEENDDLVFFHAGRSMINQLFAQIEQVFISRKDRASVSLNSDLSRMQDTMRRHSSRRKPFIEKAYIPPYDKKTEKLNITEGDISIPVICNSDEEKQTDTELISPASPEYTDLIGSNEQNSPQYGLLGSAANSRRVALDLNGCNTISLFGVPGSGKSYTLGTIVEMSVQEMRGINKLPSPIASVIFHFNESQDYPPEFVSMNQKNAQSGEIELLEKVYGAKPDSLHDILLLVPDDKVDLRMQEYPDITVAPIAFSSQELSIKDWKFLMGALGNQALYMQQLNMIMRRGRSNLTLNFIRSGVSSSSLSDTQKDYAYSRLELAEQFVDDAARLRSYLKPGRLIIVDLRDEFIEKEQALGLFVVMLNIFAGAKTEDGSMFNKLIVFDEAHKYITHSDLTSHVVEVIRQMRHQGVTVLIASQDPPSLPNEVIELSSVIILHRFNSPQWLKHIQKSAVALQSLTATQLASLAPGEAYIWANNATNPEWTKKAIKLTARPRVTMHGGNTQKAI